MISNVFWFVENYDLENEKFQKLESLRFSGKKFDIHGGVSCKSEFQTEFQGFCHSVHIESSVFIDFNPMNVKFSGLEISEQGTSGFNHQYYEGQVLALDNFLGPITLKSNSFK